MKCPSCDHTMKNTSITRRYPDLESVILIGVEEFRCSNCGECVFGYGDMEQLNRVIVSVLLKKRGVFAGREVKFIREAMGYGMEKFAELMGYDARETITRIETGKQPVTKAFDHELRAMAFAKFPVADRDYDLHDLLLNNRRKAFKEIRLTAKDTGWEFKSAA